MKKIILTIGLALLVAFGLAIAEETKPKADTTTAKKADAAAAVKKPVDSTSKESKVPEWTTTESGLKYRDLVVGQGADVKAGANVLCHYTVWLSDPSGQKGKLIQSSKGGEPFQCTLGQGLIVGWSEGMVGMKSGGTRELLVPPSLGWGDKAYGGGMIPANSTVYFEITYLGLPKK